MSSSLAWNIRGDPSHPHHGLICPLGRGSAASGAGPPGSVAALSPPHQTLELLTHPIGLYLTCTLFEISGIAVFHRLIWPARLHVLILQLHFYPHTLSSVLHIPIKVVKVSVYCILFLFRNFSYPCWEPWREQIGNFLFGMHRLHNNVSVCLCLLSTMISLIDTAEQALFCVCVLVINGRNWPLAWWEGIKVHLADIACTLLNSFSSPVLVFLLSPLSSSNQVGKYVGLKADLWSTFVLVTGRVWHVQRWASLSTCASSFYPGSTRLSWISDLPRDVRAPTVFTSQFFTSDTGEEWEACAAWGNAPAWWASSCCPRPSSAWSPTCCSSSRMGNNLKRIRSLWRSGSWVGWSEGASLWVQTNDLRTNKKVRALTVYSVNSETVWISMSVLFSLMCRLMNLSHVADAVPELLRYQGRGQGLLRHGLLWKSL